MIAMMQGYDWKFGDGVTSTYFTGSATYPVTSCVVVVESPTADACLESPFLDEQEPEEAEPNEIPNRPAVTQLRVPRRRRAPWRPVAGRRAREPPGA